MPAERLSMRQIRKVLRLRYASKQCRSGRSPRAWAGGAGNLPLEYGYLDVYSSSRTTCSGAQTVEKPSRSALVATVLTRSGSAVGPMPTAKYPTSIAVLRDQLIVLSN